MSRSWLSLFCLIVSLFSGCSAEAPEPSAEHVREPPAGSSEPPAAPEVEFRNVRMPFAGRHLLTGGQPSSAELAALAAAGYKTVVNLRPKSEDGAWDEGPELAGLGVRYVHIPVAGAEGVTVENAELLAEVVEDESAYPLVVHCASGNRVGALFAMKAFYFDGADADAALELGLASGLTRLEPVVRERLAEGDAPVATKARPGPEA